MARKRGNPSWGKAGTAVISGPSSFEQTVKALNLRPEDFLSSPRLKEWARLNKNHKYVPSDLLAAWGFEAESEV